MVGRNLPMPWQRNDVILLDGIIDERLESSPSGERGEVFELLVLEET